MLSRIISVIVLGLSLSLVGCDDVVNGDLGEDVSGVNDSKFKAGGVENGMEKPYDTILDIAAGNENFSILAQAVTFAELGDALDGKRQLTVFAPTNDAFVALLNALGLTAEELFVEENKELVKNILLYHVALGNRPAESVIESDKIRTLVKKFIEVDLEDGNVLVGNEENGFARIIDTDIFASNGVIHVINSVMIPPSSKSNYDEKDEEDDYDEDVDDDKYNEDDEDDEDDED